MSQQKKGGLENGLYPNEIFGAQWQWYRDTPGSAEAVASAAAAAAAGAKQQAIVRWIDYRFFKNGTGELHRMEDQHGPNQTLYVHKITWKPAPAPGMGEQILLRVEHTDSVGGVEAGHKYTLLVQGLLRNRYIKDGNDETNDKKLLKFHQRGNLDDFIAFLDNML
jgi:hypothetical protein